MSSPPDDLVCKKCSKILSNPMTFPCGHSFCKITCVPYETSSNAFCICTSCFGKFNWANVTENTGLADRVSQYNRKKEQHRNNLCSICKFHYRNCIVCEHCSLLLCSGCLQSHRSNLIQRVSASIESLKVTRDQLRKSKMLKENPAILPDFKLNTGIESAIMELKSANNCALRKAERFLINSYSHENKLLKRKKNDCCLMSNRLKYLLGPIKSLKNGYNRKAAQNLLQMARPLIDDVNILSNSFEEGKYPFSNKFMISKTFTTIGYQLLEIKLLIPTDPFTNELKPASQINPLSGCSLRRDLSPVSVDAAISNSEANASRNNIRNRRIFVGQLSPDITEEDLFKYFSKYGQISDSIIMRKKNSSQSRGFGYVTFISDESVTNGITDLKHVLKGCRLNVCLPQYPGYKQSISRNETKRDISTDTVTAESPNSKENSLENKFENRRLFVGQLKPDITDKNLLAYFSKFGPVSDVCVVRKNGSNESRGFGFVTFSSYWAFEKGILEMNHYLDGCRLNVKLDNNPKSRKENDQNKNGVSLGAVKVANSNSGASFSGNANDRLRIFVGRLKPDMSEMDLRTYFSDFGDVLDTVVIRKKSNVSRGFGFVTFTNSEPLNKGILDRNHFLGSWRIFVNLPETKKSKESESNLTSSKPLEPIVEQPNLPSQIPASISVETTTKPRAPCPEYSSTRNVSGVPSGQTVSGNFSSAYSKPDSIFCVRPRIHQEVNSNAASTTSRNVSGVSPSQTVSSNISSAYFKPDKFRPIICQEVNSDTASNASRYMNGVPKTKSNSDCVLL